MPFYGNSSVGQILKARQWRPAIRPELLGPRRRILSLHRAVMSSFVLDQMAEMSLGSSPLYDQPSCGTYQYDHRGSTCELQNRYWKLGIAKKKEKGKGWACFRSQHVNPEAQV